MFNTSLLFYAFIHTNYPYLLLNLLFNLNNVVMTRKEQHYPYHNEIGQIVDLVNGSEVYFTQEEFYN